MSSRDRYVVFEKCRTQVRTLAASCDLGLALADLDHAYPLAHRAFCRMQDARAGLPGAMAYDSPTVSGVSSTSSAPERLAMSVDPTQADRDLLDTTLAHLWYLVRPDALTTNHATVAAQITTDSLTLRRLVERWSPHAPSAKDLREVTATNVEATECKLTRDNLGLFAEKHRTSDLWGLLPEPAPVGRWVWRFAKDRGRLPTPMEWQHQRSKDDALRAQAMASVK